MHRSKRLIGAAGIVVTIGLVAAACGSEAATSTDAAASSSRSTEATTAATEPASEPSAVPATPAAEPEIEGPAPAPDHLFPDLDTVDVADGSTVNLADELAGGDTPILLWFYAPH